MKIRITAAAILLTALLAPAASWAVYPLCSDCEYSPPGSRCTCDGTAPHFIFTTCDKLYACQAIQPPPPAALEKSAFLASLATQPAEAPSSSR
jgi:hypothetical protein